MRRRRPRGSTVGDVRGAALVAGLVAALAAAGLAGPQPRPDLETAAAPEELAAEGGRLLDAGGGAAARAAAELFERAAAGFRRRGDLAGEAESLYGLGVARARAEERRASAAAYGRALALYRRLADRRGEAAARNNLGLLAFEEGEVAGAFEQLGAALELRRAAGDVAGEAATLQNLAALHAECGEPQEALDAYRRALAAARRAGEPGSVAATLNNLGALLTSLGRRVEAREALAEALALHRSAGDARGEAGTLNNLGRLALRQGAPGRGVEEFRAARRLFLALEDRGGAADVADNLGLARLELGAVDEAVRWFEAALALRRALGDRRGEAASRANLGQALLARGEWQAAEGLLEEALALQRRLGNPWDESATLLRLGRLRRARGRLEEALAAVDAGLELVESLRARLEHPDLRASFSATQRDLYELKIDLLMALEARQPGRGFAARAFSAAERARARSLLEILGRPRAGLPGGFGRDLEAAETTLRRRVGGLERQRSRLAAAGEAAAASQLAGEIALLLERHRELETEMRALSPAAADLWAPEPVDAAAAGELLGPDGVLLEFALGSERSFLWVVERGAVSAHVLPPRATLEAAARRLHELLAASHRRVVRGPADVAAAELSRMILAPVSARLAGRRVVVVADGALAYVPFAALPLPGDARRRPLGIDQEVLSLPSASVLGALRRSAATRRRPRQALAVVADPVFAALDRARLPGLPFSRIEAQSIAALAPAGEALLAVDLRASRDLVVGGALASYRFVHFATHARIDAEHPELSGIELTAVDAAGAPRDGTLRLLDVYGLELTADLVTLSACRTALGREVRGEGLVGLTRGFLHAGARAVLVSLWQVPDEPTAVWMERFYAGLLGEGLSPSAAARRARAAMWAEPRWAAPAYWAAFEIQGDAW